MRRCSKTGCQSPALATLTYNYADSQVVIGPLSRRAEPHTYDPVSYTHLTLPTIYSV